MTRAAPATALPRSDTVTTNPPCPSWIVSTTTSPLPPGSAITSPTLRSPGRTVSDTDRTLLVLPVRNSVGSADACGRRWPASEFPPEVRRRYTDDPGGHRLGCRAGPGQRRDSFGGHIGALELDRKLPLFSKHSTSTYRTR